MSSTQERNKETHTSLAHSEEDDGAKTPKRTLLLIYILLVLDIAAYSLVVPLVPYILIAFGGSAMENGITFCGYCITQCISSLIVGNLGDRFGRKPCLVISLLGQTIGTIAQLFAPEKWSFVVLRILTGLFDAVYPLCQAAIADVTRLADRAKYLANIDGYFSVGYIVGPILAIFLSGISYSLCLGISATIFGIAFLFSIFGFQETLGPINEINQIKAKIKELEKNPRNSVQVEVEKVRINQIKKVSMLMNQGLYYPFCSVFQGDENQVPMELLYLIDSTFGVYGAEKYGMNEATFSVVNAFQGGINAVQQIILYGFFLNKLKLNMITIVMIGGIIDLIGVVTCILAPNVAIACLGACLLSVGFGFTSPCGSSIVSTESSAENQGQALFYVLLGGTIGSAGGSALLGQLYNFFPELPFYVTLLPCIAALIIILMTVFYCVPGGKYAGMIPHDELVLSGNVDNEKVINKKLKSSSNENNEVELESVNKDIEDDEMTNEMGTERHVSPQPVSILIGDNTQQIFDFQSNEENLGEEGQDQEIYCSEMLYDANPGSLIAFNGDRHGSEEEEAI